MGGRSARWPLTARSKWWCAGVSPAASHRWNKPRLWQTAVRLQYEQRLNLLPLITHTVAFAEAPALFARIDAGEPGMLQSVLTFGA